MLDQECDSVTVWRLVMNQLEGLHDRAELIEPWVGLGLTLSVFLLALLLLPL
jgi:hypothetical protein